MTASLTVPDHPPRCQGVVRPWQQSFVQFFPLEDSMVSWGLAGTETRKSR
jgi:hypothetical protein